MQTPTHSEIIERARQLYAEDCFRKGCPELANVNPEISELAENGFLSAARSELMMSEDVRYKEEVAREANRLGIVKATRGMSVTYEINTYPQRARPRQEETRSLATLRLLLFLGFAIAILLSLR
jgi:hypothetical protein